MYYYILNNNAKVLSRSNVQRVTQLELQTDEYKLLFVEFDNHIKVRLKCKERGYEGSKPNSQDCAHLIEFDSEFNDKFNRIYNNTDIPEVDNCIPEVLEDTYINMELAMPRGESEIGPEFARVTKRLRDANGIPIGTANNNLLFDTRIYEVEYADGYKASLIANSIAMNKFVQVDDEGNRHVLFDSLIDNRNVGTNIKVINFYIKSKNCGRRRKEKKVGKY